MCVLPFLSYKKINYVEEHVSCECVALLTYLSGFDITLYTLSPKQYDQMLYPVDELYVYLRALQTEGDSDGGQLQH